MTQTATEATTPRHKPGDVVYAVRVHTWGQLKGESEDFAPWEPPKLTEKGKPFKPAVGKPGSTVLFEIDDPRDANLKPRNRRKIRMTGQVWSNGPDNNSVWVVKDQVAYRVQG